MSRALGMPPTSLCPATPPAQSHNSHGGAAQQSHLHARGRPGGRIRFQDLRYDISIKLLILLVGAAGFERVSFSLYISVT